MTHYFKQAHPDLAVSQKRIPTGESHAYSSPACSVTQFRNVCPPPAFANKLGTEHPTHIVTFDDSVVENEVDGEVAEDERHKKNPDMWHNQHPKMKILLHRLEKKHGFKATHIYSRPIFGFASNLSEAQILQLKSIPTAHIEENQPIQLAQIYGVQWYDQIFNNQTVSWGIYATGANLSSAKSGANSQIKDLSNSRIYILDSGVAKLADLNVTKTFSSNIDGSSNDCHGHGTQVAQIAAARNNTTGVAGVAPGAQIISIKITEGCTRNAATSSAVRAINIAINNEVQTFFNTPNSYSLMGAGVINLSAVVLSNETESNKLMLKNALNKAASQTTYYTSFFFGSVPVYVRGLFTALGVGNDNVDACTIPSAVYATQITGVVSVGGIDATGTKRPASNYGGCAEVWAPGGSISVLNLNSALVKVDGTSFATPFIAGIAALISDKYRTYLPGQIETQLKSNMITTSTYCPSVVCTQPYLYSTINVPQANSY